MSFSACDSLEGASTDDDADDETSANAPTGGPARVRGRNGRDHSARLDSAHDPHRPLMLVFGWAGAKERQLEALKGFYTEQGFDCLVVIVPPSVVMLRQDRWPAAMAQLAEHVEAHLSRMAKPRWHAHLFSNAGFISYTLLLEALETRPALRQALGRVVLDSSPSLLPNQGALVFSDIFARGALAMLRLGGRPLIATRTGQLLGPFVRAALFGHWLVNPFVRWMSQALAVRFVELHPKRPMLFLHGHDDRIIPIEMVREFVAFTRSAQHDCRLSEWADAPHVALLKRDRERYFAELSAFGLSAA